MNRLLQGLKRAGLSVKLSKVYKRKDWQNIRKVTARWSYAPNTRHEEESIFRVNIHGLSSVKVAP